MTLAMAQIYLSPAFRPDTPPQNSHDIEIVDVQDAVQDNNDEYMVAEQLANDNSWRSGDIEMADVTDAVPDTGSSLFSSGLTSRKSHQLVEDPAPESPSGSRSMTSPPLSEFDTEPGDDIGDSRSQREERATTPQSENGIEILDKYAFNFNRGAYNHRVPQRFTGGMNLKVARLYPHSITLAQHRQKLDETGEREVCPSLIPVPNEIGPRSQSDVECVWVGMLPSQTSTQHSGAKIAQLPVDAAFQEADISDNIPKKPVRKKAPVSGSILHLTEDDMTVAPFDPNALRVVAKKSNKATKNWYLYALVNPSPRTELCEGYKIGMDDVYFFKQFRDDQAKTFMPRKHATQEQIKAKIFSPLSIPTFSGSPRLLDNTSTVPNTAATQAKTGETNGGLGLVHQARPWDDPITSAMMQYISQTGGPKNSSLEDNMERCEDKDLDGTGVDLESSSGLAFATGEQDGHDDQIYPSPMTAATEAARGSYQNEMIEELKDEHVKFSKLKQRIKFIMFQDTESQHLDKYGAPIQFDDAGSAVVHDGDGDYHLPRGRNMMKEAARLTEQITEVINRLAAREDVAGLDQALTVLKSLEHGRRSSGASVLGLYLNVPAEGDTESRIDVKELWVSQTLVTIHCQNISVSCRCSKLTTFLYF